MDGGPTINSVLDLKHAKELEGDFNNDVFSLVCSVVDDPTRLPWPPEKKLKGGLSFDCLVVRLVRQRRFL